MTILITVICVLTIPTILIIKTNQLKKKTRRMIENTEQMIEEAKKELDKLKN